MKKKVLSVFIAVMLVVTMLVPGVSAAESKSGIYDVQITDGVDVQIDVDGAEASEATVSGKQYYDFYENAEKLSVSYGGAVAGEQYVIFVLEDGTEPTEDNIVYIDQLEGSDFNVSFNPYPSRLENGKTYNIYMSGETLSFTKVGEFKYTTKASETDDGSISEDDVQLITHTISLEGNIGINYYFKLSDTVLKDDGAKVVFTMPNDRSNEVAISDGTRRTYSDGSYVYGYSCDVYSTQMTGDVIAKVVLSDGRETEEFPYTVKAYADIVIANKNNSAAFTKATPLVKSMLNYGAYAQTYFKYDGTDPANIDLSDEEKDVSSVTKEMVADHEIQKSGSQEGITYYAPTLVLKSETSIRHYFKLDDGYSISSFTFTCDGNELTPVKSGQYYYVEIPNIASGNLDTLYTVSVGGFSVTYSALSYVYSQLNKNSDAELMDLCRAIYLYNQEANTYFGK